MVCYFGGKYLTGKKIYEAIKNDVIGKDIKDYIEPFCGGLNVIKYAVDDYNKFNPLGLEKFYASDNSKDLIFLWSAVKNGEFNNMPVISKERYNELKKDNTLSIDRSFAMYYCSFSCMYNNGYLSNKLRNYHDTRYRSIKKEEHLIKKMEFKCCEYYDIDVSDGGHIIYCDPPYNNTTQCYYNKIFDSSKFWTQVKLWKDQGNYVYVSELECPLDNIIIYSKVKNISVGSIKNNYMIDNLYKIL